jgi:hypothetical protein
VVLKRLCTDTPLPHRPDARDSLGASPLTLAVQHQQHLAFLTLLHRGANVDTVDIRGAGIVHWAAYKGGCCSVGEGVR